MGEKLLEEVVDATGLPEDMMSKELNRLVSQAGLESKDLTLEDLRTILAEYVQDVLLAAQKEFSETES